MRARHPSRSSKRKLYKPFIIEELETRRLLTTFVGGDQFRFVDNNNDVIEINFFGNITAEVIGAHVVGGQGALINLPAAEIGTLLPTTPDGNSLFAIYVSQSDFTGGITVAQVPYTLNAGGGFASFGVTQPFNGSIGAIRVNNAQGGGLFNANAFGGTGVALLGARTLTPANGDTNDIPILTLPVNQTFGVLPTSITELTSGLTVAPGNSMNNFLFGGTILGNVNIGGAINTFYCGWLLTGNANGEDGDNTITDPQNFTVLGDIRNLDVMGSIGTIDDGGVQNPAFMSGFDMYVAGTIGNVQTFAATAAIVGSINAANLTGVPDDGDAQTQLNAYPTVPGKGFDFFDNDELGGQAGDVPADGEGGTLTAAFINNTYATAQYLSNGYNATLGSDNSIVVDGIIEDDTVNAERVNYYAVPLMAGQTITVQVQDGNQGGLTDAEDLDVGVFDPDGREIASDYNNNIPAETEEKPFQFTTDRPGVYRFAVAPEGDSTFVGTGPTAGDLPYELTIQNVGHMAIGSIVSAANILDNEELDGGNAGFGAQSADIGAIVAGGTILSNSDDAISVENGSLRCLEAGTIGGPANTDPDVEVPNGSVGLLESTTGNLDFNNVAEDDTVLDETPPAIGGDYEVVSAAGNLAAGLVCDGDIGTIRAGTIGAVPAAGIGEFQVDANNASGAGRIDLIDDAGNYGNNEEGGTPITLGPGGDLRYMNVLGAVYQDEKFGDILPAPQTFPTNSPDQVVEPSGSVVTLTPVGTTANALPQLTVTTFGLEDGGSAIVNVTSSGGLDVTASGDLSDQAAEIGAIDVEGNGNAVTAGAGVATKPVTVDNLQTPAVPAPPTLGAGNIPVNLIFSGNTQIDAFQVTGGNFDEIANNTPGGEIVNLTAGSIGTLTGSGNVGVDLQHDTPAAILPTAVISNTYPFNGERTGAVVNGSVVTVSLPIVGNLDVNGSVGTLSGTIEGAVDITGSVNSVNFQKGIYPSGSGNLANAGLFVNGVIGNVSNSVPGDIRGNVISTTGIDSIHVNNGSIIGASIGTPTEFADASNLNEGEITIEAGSGDYTTPTLSLGTVTVTGDGGIIGTNIITGDAGVISSLGGFGIFTTNVVTGTLGTVQEVITSGYGERDFTFIGGATFGELIAEGNGSLESTANFSPDVQYSENSAFDPYFGTIPNTLTDIDSYLGTTAAEPVIPGVTDTGIVENATMEGTVSLRSINCYEIRSTAPATTPCILSFSNKITNISTSGPIDGLEVTTGKLATLQTGGNLMHTTLTIAGRITRLIIRANLTDSSSIVAEGRNGNIGNLRVVGNMDGVIQADGGKIGTIQIYGDLFGQIKTRTISDLVLYQNLGDGSLDITGSAGTIQFVGDLGQPGDTLTVAGSVNTLKVGGNLTANVSVGGHLNQLEVNGSIVTGSKVTVANVLNLLKVGSDFQAGAIVQATAVKKVKIGGLDDGSIVIV
jgi:hypothetical protein